MERQRISGIYADAAAFADREITVCGWVRTIRDMKNFGFVELNDGSCHKSLQVVLDRGNLSNYDEIAHQNVAAALVASAGVTLVEWLSMVTQESTNASLMSLYAFIYGYDSSAAGQLKSFVLSFVWSGSAAFVGTFLSLMYWRLSKLWRWIVTLGMGAVLVLLLNAVTISVGFLNAVVRFFRWLGAAPLNLCVFLIGVAIAFAVFDWLLARKAPITAATA